MRHYKIYLQEVSTPSSYSRFIHKNLVHSSNFKIQRVPFDWSGFEQGYLFTFNHHITFFDPFVYSMNNPLTGKMRIEKRHFVYSRVPKQIRSNLENEN